MVSLGTQLCRSHEHLMGTLAKGNTSLHDHLHIITHLRRPHRTELHSMGHLHTQCVSARMMMCVYVCVGACLRICSGLIVHLTHALWWCSEITIKMTHVPSLSWHHTPALCWSIQSLFWEWRDWEALSLIYDFSSLPPLRSFGYHTSPYACLQPVYQWREWVQSVYVVMRWYTLLFTVYGNLVQWKKCKSFPVCILFKRCFVWGIMAVIFVIVVAISSIYK